MGENPNARQLQDDLEQYKMPNALKQPRNEKYNVGYEASTGNQTSPNRDIDKKG